MARLSAAQLALARTLLGGVKARGLPAVVGEIVLAVAGAESSIRNLANDGSSTQVGSFREGRRQLTSLERADVRTSLRFPNDGVAHDLDSCGWAQQRQSASWGPPSRTMQPLLSLASFLDGFGTNRGLLDLAWQQMTPWNAAQKVQGSPSSDGGIYREWHGIAVQVVADLWPTLPGPWPDPTPPNTEPKEPDVATKEETEAAAKSAADPIPARSAAEAWDSPITRDGTTATARDTLAATLTGVYQLLKGRVVGRATVRNAQGEGMRVELNIEDGTYRGYPSEAAYDARSVQLTELGYTIREFGEIDPAAQGWVREA